MREFRISASAVKSKKACDRKWASERLGYRKPGGAAANLGTAVHKHAENYLEHGLLPKNPAAKAARLFDVLRPKLPVHPELRAERRFVREWGNGIVFHGAIDISAPYLTNDIKTSSNPQPVDLATDEQALLYGWDGCLEFGTSWTLLGWLYVNTRTVEALPPHEHKITLEECEQGIEESILPHAREMLWLEENELCDLKDADEQDKIRYLNTLPNMVDMFGPTCRWCAFEKHCDKWNGKTEKEST